MKENDVFIISDETLVRVVDQIKDEPENNQWQMQMPESFMRKDKKPVTLREIINYHAYDDAWVPDILAGRTMEEAGMEKFDGDLLDDDPKGSFKAIAEKACAAARDADLARITHLTYGDYPASEYFKHITLFRTLRAYEIAKVIGADPTLPPELVQGLWDEVYPQAEEWRAMGIFGAKVEVPDDAPLQERLLGLTGRQPK
jgi:uncharacterized protein (TIGR03086 family)